MWASSALTPNPDSQANPSAESTTPVVVEKFFVLVCDADLSRDKQNPEGRAQVKSKVNIRADAKVRWSVTRREPVRPSRSKQS